jgi:predicted dehydrogenase
MVCEKNKMMPRKITVGLLGLVHDHVFLNDEINHFLSIEGVEVACAADVNEILLRRVANMGVKNIYRDYREMLAKEELDAVAVYAENARHAEYTEAAAEKGLHVMVEKPMASNFEIAKRMFEVSKRYNVKLMINYPTTWSPSLRHAVKIALDGNIGRVYEVRFRAAHKGPKEEGCSPYFYSWLYDEKLNGAGAYIDFCCYGANFSRWILGMPEKVCSMGGNYVKDYISPLEDNAILLMSYKRGMGIAEASWSQIPGEIGPFYMLTIRGTEGTVAANFTGPVKAYFQGGSWTEVNPPPLEEGSQNAAQHFIYCILKDTPFLEPVSAKFNLEVQAILEAGLLSMKEDKTIYLSEILKKMG